VPNTTYIVLRHTNAAENTPGPPHWEVENAAVEASSADAAIRKTITLNGRYVAVPARSWKPVTVTTETKTVLKLEQPSA
jgi:hypothetical protein